jgi:hypothetical protein
MMTKHLPYTGMMELKNVKGSHPDMLSELNGFSTIIKRAVIVTGVHLHMIPSIMNSINDVDVIGVRRVCVQVQHKAWALLQDILGHLLSWGTSLSSCLPRMSPMVYRSVFVKLFPVMRLTEMKR